MRTHPQDVEDINLRYKISLMALQNKVNIR